MLLTAFVIVGQFVGQLACRWSAGPRLLRSPGSLYACHAHHCLKPVASAYGCRPTARPHRRVLCAQAKKKGTPLTNKLFSSTETFFVHHPNVVKAWKASYAKKAKTTSSRAARAGVKRAADTTDTCASLDYLSFPLPSIPCQSICALSPCSRLPSWQCAPSGSPVLTMTR